MTKPRILLAEKSSFSHKGIQSLQQLGQLEAADLSQRELEARIGDYDVLVLRLGLRVDPAVLANAARLRAIVTPTTGTDHIDLAAAEHAGVAVLSLKGEREFLDQVYATAEHSFALLFSLVRHIPSAFEAVKRYDWRRDLYRGHELAGKVIGLVGCGRLGTMMVRYAQAFHMPVLVYDPYQKQLPAGVEQVAQLDVLLQRSDIVSLHVPLNDETEAMLGADAFAQMRSGALLINTARGAVVDEAALLAALQSGKLAGAALDVVCDEHLIARGARNALIEYAKTKDNLILTPHIGGATFESVEKADLFVIRKLTEWMEGKL